MDYTELAENFLENMHTINKAGPHKSINRFIQGEGFVMQYLCMHGGAAAPGDISREMGISTARIAAALKTLEEKGLVVRGRDENDHRKVRVVLTKAGEDKSRMRRIEMLEGTKRMLEGLGGDDAAEFVRILAKIAYMASEKQAYTH